MYHYVRNLDTNYPNFNALDTESFKKQMDYFTKNGGIGNAKELIDIIDGKIKPNEKFYLTFDDGFKEHYHYVAKQLEKINATGFFFPSTLPLITKKILDVHKVHLLLGKYKASVLLSEALAKINNNMLDNSKIKNFDKEIYIDQKNTQSQKKFKRLFNYYLKYEFREEILNQIFSQYFEEEKLHDNVYMNSCELLELQSLGNIIGSHTHSHKVLSRLNFNDQKHEIIKSEEILKEILGNTWIENKTLCYPYGGYNSFNASTQKILKQRNYKLGFMVGNVKMHLNKLIYPYSIKRIDCNRY